MNKPQLAQQLFPFNTPVSAHFWRKLQLQELVLVADAALKLPRIVLVRRLVERLNRLPERSGNPVPPGLLHLYGLVCKVYRYVIDHFEAAHPEMWQKAIRGAGYDPEGDSARLVIEAFCKFFPPVEVATETRDAHDFLSADPDRRGRNLLLGEMLLLRVAAENPALDPVRELVADHELVTLQPEYAPFTLRTERELANTPPVAPFEMPIPQLLRAPVKASPNSLSGQMDYIRLHWRQMLPPEMLEEITVALDIVKEEERAWWSGPGLPQVLQFPSREELRAHGAAGYEYPEYERFSPDIDWMADVVMMAKMVYVWLDQLSLKYGTVIQRLDQIPDEELDTLARWGFTALWLIGLWERSPASQKIKQLSGNPDAISSAYSLYDYMIAADLGGEEALNNLKGRAWQRGIRLASDMVPNHTGIYSRWTVEHPDWFVSLDYPPYPAYRFTGPDLSFDGRVSLQIEDGYWDKRDAAVVFKHVDNQSGHTRYIYHGNDGTSTPWNDTAQLNYLLPQVREAVIQTILHVARQFPIIRFDAAMTLAKKHYQRLWYPQPGHGSGVPSRAEHGMSRDAFDAAFPVEFWREVVDRVAAEAPDTLLLAEAFWLMEGYFVRTLGMHRVYNSAFMNMLKMEENAKYRQTVKNVLEFNPEILKRFVNFMNNPDERTAIEQFGKEGKYIGAAVLLVTMPGLPMIGHGQVEGFHEKYGMEYRRAYWNEPVDEHLVAVHEAKIFPLMRRRHLFSGSENFIFYDFFTADHVDENVFAYSNRSGNERGIIIYHNTFASTAGWIRTSTARAEKIDSGETVLRQTSLGEALSFNSDGRYYYGFRDYASGMEYIRAGRELCEKGLFVELEAYEFHAFLDFREIIDDEYGTWGRMCHVLEGRPVISLDEEVKRIRYGSVIDRFGTALQRCSSFFLSPEEVERAAAREALTDFYSALNETTMCGGDAEQLAEEALLEMAASARIVAPQKEEKSRRMKAPSQPAEPGRNHLLLAAFLMMHRSGRLARSKDYSKTAACWFDELGLAAAFAGSFDGARVTDDTKDIDGAAAALLLETVLARQELFLGWDRATAAETVKELFEDDAAGRFLGRHWSDGKEWFNKERFELLVFWLMLSEAVLSLRPPRRTIKRLPSLNIRHEDVAWLASLALEAGYQTEAFLELLSVEGKSKRD
ncbi:alpha-amylase family glycosyl hydrolase [Geobacter sp. DSM 9736]|uniref:alpha-amylase family glycosyl hydrolase n=1 Tax=Geobacter sp. DSM 9736 TaxID=1277350 RepID=UPI000B506F8E|nr:alpha-amylase family glycosyl hydrolase [Geobacter sp. DSM 9736]SNB48088.1 Glycosidase [Geobacter sp. DSM 9736]